MLRGTGHGGGDARRRALEHRRSARRRLPGWIWWLLGIFLLVGFMLFVLHHNQKEQFRPPVVVSAANLASFSFQIAEFCEIFRKITALLLLLKNCGEFHAL
jgi:alpha-1,4-galacturonosyltransferase